MFTIADYIEETTATVLYEVVDNSGKVVEDSFTDPKEAQEWAQKNGVTIADDLAL